jgi:hypothetical protein
MGVRASDRPGYDNIKFASEVATDTSKKGFGVGKKDEGIVDGSLLRLQHCKLGRKLAGVPSLRNS